METPGTLVFVARVEAAVLLSLYCVYLLFIHVSHTRFVETPESLDIRRPSVRHPGRPIAIALLVAAPVLTFYCGSALLSATSNQDCVLQYRSTDFVGVSVELCRDVTSDCRPFFSKANFTEEDVS